MFENLSPRERKLVYATLGLVPLALVFMCVFWYINRYNQNEEQLDSLSKSLASEKEIANRAINANRRRNYYNSVALPSNYDVANNDYGSWLKLLMEEEGFRVTSFQPRDTGSLRVSPSDPEIGFKKKFQINAKGNLAQLNSFLKKFYSTDLLHRINTLKIIPQTEGTGKTKVRTGDLSLIMAIETLALSDVEDRPDFVKATRELARDAQEYDTLLRRNIFGPANNPPTLSVTKTIRAYTGESATVRFTGRDVDDSDELSFELLESGVEDIEMKTTSSSARFSVKSEKEGEFKFKVRVFDSGFPPKESIAETTVVFKDRPPKVETKVVEKPKPVFKYLPHTRVTQISRERDGAWVAYVKVRPLKKNYLVKVGDSFELDEQTWQVTAIAAKEVSFRAGEKTYVARMNPSDQGKLIEVSAKKEEPAESEVSKTADF